MQVHVNCWLLVTRLHGLTEDTNLRSHYCGYLRSHKVIWKFLMFESEELTFEVQSVFFSI